MVSFMKQKKNRRYLLILLTLGLLLSTLQLVRAAPEDSLGFGFVTSSYNFRATNPPTFQLKWGSEGSGDGQFSQPGGMALDSSGNIYVADTFNDRIQKFDSNGTFITKWGSSGSEDGQLSSPEDVAVDSSGNVYVVDLFNDRIQKFDSNGTFITKWGSNGSGDGQFAFPDGIAIDSNDNVYVGDLDNNRIQKFDSNGTFITKWGSNGSGDGQFAFLRDVAVDGNNNVYVAEGSNHRIQKFDSNGTFITKWGSNGSGDGQFNGPAAVVVDNDGNVYVADTESHRIQKFDSNGTFITKWGSNGSGDGQFNRPFGIAVDSSSNVYVADTENHRIQKFVQSSGETTVSLQSVNFPARYLIGKPDGSAVELLEVTEGDDEATKKRAVFKLLPGLANPSLVSLQVNDSSGRYVVATSGGVILQSQNDIVDLNEATFKKVAGLAGSGVSFESSTQANHYLRHFSFILRLDQNDGSQLYKNDASFIEVAPLSEVDVVTLTPGQSSTFTIGNIQGLSITVFVPTDAVIEIVQLTRQGLTSVTGVPTGLQFANIGFEMDAQVGGTPQPGYTFNQPINVTIDYSEADIAGLSEETLGLYYRDEGSGAWKQDGITVLNHDQNNNQLVVSIAHITQFGLFGANASDVVPIITTIAGNGDSVYSGDGGPATEASFRRVEKIAVDAVGNIYVAESRAHRIRKVDTNGIISTVAGNGVSGFSGDGGPATEASLKGPKGIGVDTAGNLYIADTFNHRIRKVDTNGIITTVVGTGVEGFSGDDGLAIDARLNDPIDVLLDSDGNLYIAEFSNGRVRKVDTNDIITTVAGSGFRGFGGDGGPATEALFQDIWGIGIDTAGNLYIADKFNGRIRKVDTNGIITTVAGNGFRAFSGDGGPATEAGLRWPQDVTVDTAGNLYIADDANHLVRRVDTTGVITTVVGNYGVAGFSGDGGPATEANLHSAYDVALDSAGNLYIADYKNYRIRKVTLGNSTEPEPEDPPDCSQEAFLIAVQAGETSKTITLDGNCRYVLTSANNDWNGGSGAFLFSTTLIEGNGAIIEREANAPKFRILASQVDAGTTIRNLTIRNGASTEDGGGIFANSNLTLEDVIFEGNSSDKSGGAIYAAKDMNLNKVMIKNSQAGNNGGAIYSNGGDATIHNSKLFNNQAVEYGGAIFKEAGGLDVTNTVFAQNNSDSGKGAAIFIGGSASSVNIINNTITDNAKNTGRALVTWSSLNLQNTIIANHGVALLAGGEGNIVSEDYNLFVNNTIDVDDFNKVVNRGGNSVNVPDAQFVNAAALDYSLKKSSPAADRGTNSVLSTFPSLATDAAGLTRPFSGTPVDIGAYELQDVGGPSLSIVKDGPLWVAQDVPVDFRLTVANDGVGTANQLEVVDVLPDGAIYVPDSATPTATFANGELTWQIGTLAPGEKAFLSYQVMASQTLVSEEYSVQSLSDPTVQAEGEILTLLFNAKIAAAINFFPNPDGFSFSNYSDSPDSDFTADDMVIRYGADQVCKSQSPCVLKATAEAFRKSELEWVSGGHCAGLAMVSLNIFANATLAPSDFQAGVNVTYDITKDNARKELALYAMAQNEAPINMPTVPQNIGGKGGTSLDVLNALITNFNDTNAQDRYRISFSTREGKKGHTVVPYAVEQINDKDYLIYIYENNRPNETDLAIRINGITGVWSYVGTTRPDEPLLGYEGDLNSGNLRLTSWQWHSSFPKVCGEACTASVQHRAQNNGTLEFQLNGEGYLLITRSDGLRAGFDLMTEQFISEITGVERVDRLTGLEFNLPSAIRIPHVAGMTYSIEVANNKTAYGNTEAPANVNISGPGFAFNVKDLVLNSSWEQTNSPVDLMDLTLNPDTKRLTFDTGTDDPETPSLSFAYTRLDGSDYSVDVNNVSINKGHAIALSFDEANDSITIEDNSAGQTNFQVEVKRINSNGTTDTFTSNSVSDGGQAGVTLNVGAAWTGATPPIQVEENATLPPPTGENADKKVFLPIIIR